MQTVGWEKQHFKKFPTDVNHNSINIKTYTDKMVPVLTHSAKKSIDHSFLSLC